MWVLKRIPDQEHASDSLQFYLLPGRQYVVGRKDCDVVVPGDATVSRKHAVISITKDQQEGKYSANIKDTSKTGVLLNGSKITGNTDVTVNNEDLVSFGRNQIKFKFISYIIEAVTSGISKSNQKLKIKNTIQKLGGRMCSDWEPDVTHLIMDKVMFTIKVVYALACGKSIVTPKFFDDLLDCVDQKKGNFMPTEKDYLPPVAEQTMLDQDHLFLPNEARKTLLVGKVFVFFTAKQHKRMKAAVEYARGTVQLHETKDKGLLRKVSSTQLLFVQVESKDLKEMDDEKRAWIQGVQDILKGHNLRAVAESEIGIAILYASMDKFCNPAISKVPTLCNTSYTQSMSSTQASEGSQICNNATRSQKEVPSPDRKRIEDDQKKRKRVVSEETFKHQTVKKVKVDAKPDNVVAGENSQSKTVQKNIIDIDDEDDDDNFQFDETALSCVRQYQNSVKPRPDSSIHQTQCSKITEPHIVRQTRNITKPGPDSMRQTRHGKKPELGNTASASVTDEKRKKNSESEKENRVSEIADIPSNVDRTTLVPNTEFVSDVEKSPNITQFTSASKKAIPETALNVTNDILDDFDYLDDELDPFPFDIPDPSGPGFEKSATKTTTTNRTQNSVQIENQVGSVDNEDDDEKPSSRFLKAMASSQDSNSGDVMVLDSQGNLVPQQQTTTLVKEQKIEDNSFSNGWKQTDISRNYSNSSKINNNNSSSSDSNNNNNNNTKKNKNCNNASSQHNSRKNIQNENKNSSNRNDDDNDNDDLSHMLEDDEHVNVMISEEFPPVAKQQMVSKDGWLSTHVKMSTSIVPKEDPDLEDIPRDLIQTRFDSLVVKATTQQQQRQKKIGKRNSRNTKCFKKQMYAGHSHRNVVLKGSDLVVFKSSDEDRANMFDTFREEYDQEEEDEKRITQMFDKVTR